MGGDEEEQQYGGCFGHYHLTQVMEFRGLRLRVLEGLNSI